MSIVMLAYDNIYIYKLTHFITRQRIGFIGKLLSLKFVQLFGLLCEEARVKLYDEQIHTFEAGTK